MVLLKLLPRSPWIRNCYAIQKFVRGECLHNTRNVTIVSTGDVRLRPQMNFKGLGHRDPAMTFWPKYCRPFAIRRGVTGGPPNDNEWRDFRLMDFPRIVWPSIINTIKNWITAKVIIRPYFDRDFSLDTFAVGARQAMLYVSTLLSQGNFERMDGLVTPEALIELKKNHPHLSLQQRHLLSLRENNIYFAFPYQVGIILEETTQKRFVEITMCFHCLLVDQSVNGPDPTVEDLFKYGDKIIICNSRFIKEFTKGAESDWTINIINFFRPASLENVKKS